MDGFGWEEKEEKKKKKRKLGGLKTLPFILSNEVCDRFAAAGFGANMIIYLEKQLHLPLVQATKTISNFAGTASLTPLVGALIADSFAGRFWTITVGAMIYQLGILGVAISALVPALRPPPCHHKSQTCIQASTWQLAIFYMCLLLTAVGSGGIRPCVVAFGADQLELDGPKKPRPGEPKPRWSFFNLYFFCMGASLMLALTVVVYIQDNVGWGLGFGIPAIAMFVAIVVFVAGYRFYIMRKPCGSPLTRLAQVVVAAVRKRKLSLPADASLLYQNKEFDADISTAGCLLHTDNFRFLDRAAIDDGDRTETGRARPWRLSTVHRVEELKLVIRMLPIWSAGILFYTASSNYQTLSVIQAKSMNRHLTHSFKIPAATLSIFSSSAMLLTVAIYDRLLVPFARRLTGRLDGISFLRRIAAGLAISILYTGIAALVEMRRRDASEAEHRLSAFWLVPQYAVHGIAEAFAAVGLLEFMYDQSPESMKSSAVALYWLSISAGQYGAGQLVQVVSNITKKSREGSWLKDNINSGRLDNYYWLLAGLQVFNFCYYLVCMRFYRFKPLEIADGDEDIPAEENIPAESADEEKGSGELELVGAKHGKGCDNCNFSKCPCDSAASEKTI